MFTDVDTLDTLIRQLVDARLADVLPDVIADNLRLSRSRPLRGAGVPTKLTGTVANVGTTTADVQLDDDAPGILATVQMGAAVSVGDRVVILHDPSGGAVIVGNGSNPGSGAGSGGLDARVIELEQAKLANRVFYPEGFDRVTGIPVALDSGLGALGDRVTDDTVSWNAAIQAAGASSDGGVVWGTPGKGYAHTATLLVNLPHVSIQSATAFSAFLKPLAAMPQGQVQIAANDCAVRNIGFQPGNSNYTLNPAADCIRIEGLNGGQSVQRTRIESCSAFFCNGYFVNSQPFGGLLANAQPDVQHVAKCDCRDGAGGIRIMGGGSTRSVGGHLESCYTQSNSAPCYDFQFAHDIQVIGCSGGMTGPSVVNGIATMLIHGDCAAINVSSTALGAQRNSGSNALLVEKDLSTGDAPFNIDFSGCIFEFAENSAKVTEGDGINFVNCWFTLAGLNGLLINGTAIVSLSNCGFNDNATWATDPPLLSSDSFNRANNLTTLGSTDGSREFEPGAWVPLTGVWGIDTNQAYAVSTPGGGIAAIAYRDLAETDVDLRLKISHRDSSTGIAFRILNSTNYFVFLSDDAGNCQLYRWVSGIQTGLGTNHNVGNADGDVLRVTTSGNNITIWRAQAATPSAFVALETIVDSTFAAQTLAGMTTFGIGGRFDNWTAFRNVGSVVAYEIDVQNAAGVGQTWMHLCKFSSTNVTAATRQKTGNVVGMSHCTNNTGKPLFDTTGGYASPKHVFWTRGGGNIEPYIISGADVSPISEAQVTNLVADLAALQASVGTKGLAIYGDGSDGTRTFDGVATILGLVPAAGVYTLTRDIYLADGSALTGSAIINTNGYRIFCRGTLTTGASTFIRNNGSNGAVGVGGAGAVAGFFGAGAAGANGGVGANGATPANITNAIGAGGGASGASSGGPGTGGGRPVSTVTAPTGPSGLPRNIGQALSGAAGFAPALAGAAILYVGGNGGAGGDAAASSTGGGGGGGGGVVGIYVKTLVNNGQIRARGGDGAAGSGAGTGAGGGGGGGGGAVIAVYDTLTGNAPSAPGGNGGAAQGAGKAGANGSAGQVFQIANV